MRCATWHYGWLVVKFDVAYIVEYVRDANRYEYVEVDPATVGQYIRRNDVNNIRIFDSHVGSGSIRIACHDMGFDFEGCEIDKDYWEAQEKRYQQHISQIELFSPEEIQKAIYQEELF